MQCLWCGKETKNPKFCSKSCREQNYTKKTLGKRKKKNRICTVCKKEFIGANQTCSFECRKNSKHPNIVDFDQRLLQYGEYYTKGQNPTTKPIKKYLIAKYGNKCMICGHPSVWNNLPLILILDHINGHADDWSKDNIRLVCPNCDSQLPTFKARNKGNSKRKYTITQKV